MQLPLVALSQITSVESDSGRVKDWIVPTVPQLEQFGELERVILESRQEGMFAVLGDFNAHLGSRSSSCLRPRGPQYSRNTCGDLEEIRALCS